MMTYFKCNIFFYSYLFTYCFIDQIITNSSTKQKVSGSKPSTVYWLHFANFDYD